MVGHGLAGQQQSQLRRERRRLLTQSGKPRLALVDRKIECVIEQRLQNSPAIAIDGARRRSPMRGLSAKYAPGGLPDKTRKCLDGVVAGLRV